ncbi:hypothetical protein [Paragemmobacter straminiformis]|uniref:Uncharacterized protein n=1 Tax=Paragemmobacter straminiformis TaxID=2045119 RepID=A0A842I650_9RHOB|nr:hypothetical protein [Gemmobacter straminiformis]MBC2835061.1 hypothetical protein [Gemmobacter straminiformis]
MFCAHDPGLAVFLAETAPDDSRAPGRLEWAAFSVTALLALLVLCVPS